MICDVLDDRVSLGFARDVVESWVLERSLR